MVAALGVDGVADPVLRRRRRRRRYRPHHLDRLARADAARVFLLPGVGAQGGRVDDLGPVFTIGPASGLISLSRGLVQAHRLSGGDPAAAARREAQRLREQAWALVA